MAYYYTDRSREGDATALPDVEVWHATLESCDDCGEPWCQDDQIEGEDACASCGNDRTVTETGWWYAYGFPGCLHDSDPIGPFDTREQALADAREGA